ncbi:phosphatase PAP2 family protein [Halobacteria archaeon AArc-dxtr1]|nr:phosphatase PAP2 family protein [Halobacteria archaeon AArc-dxtr1]
MSRGIGEFEPIQNLVPEWVAVVVAMLTQLGSIWFLALLLGALYWAGASDRDGIATVAGVWLAGLGLYKGLKELFGLPRPEEALLDPALLPGLVQPLYELTATASGYGFPSGHAVGATLVYIGLANVLSVGTRRLRHLAAAVIIAIVSLSRVALGVHYLVDVVVGVALGLLIWRVARQLLHRRTSDQPTIAFALAVGGAGIFVGTSGGSWESVVVATAALGAFAGWQLVTLGRWLQRPRVGVRPVFWVSARFGLAMVALAPLALLVWEAPISSPAGAGGLVGLGIATLLVWPVTRWHYETNGAPA